MGAVFFFFVKMKESSHCNTKKEVTHAGQPGQFGKIRHGTVDARESMWHERWCHQRVGERPPARDGEHSRPLPSPNSFSLSTCVPVHTMPSTAAVPGWNMPEAVRAHRREFTAN